MAENRSAERPWLSAYPPGIPQEIDADALGTVVDLFDRSVLRFAGRPALTCFGATLRFREVGARSGDVELHAQDLPTVLFGDLRQELDERIRGAIRTRPQGRRDVMSTSGCAASRAGEQLRDGCRWRRSVAEPSRISMSRKGGSASAATSTCASPARIGPAAPRQGARNA